MRIKAASITGQKFGGGLAIVAFITVILLAFHVLGYAMGAPILFLHRRLPTRNHLRYDVVWYILAHFKTANTGSDDQSRTA
jgi:hypothetical protein